MPRQTAPLNIFDVRRECLSVDTLDVLGCLLREREVTLPDLEYARLLLVFGTAARVYVAVAKHVLYGYSNSSATLFVA
jgi:hypothetical protein